MNKNKQIKEKARGKSIALKILLCMVAMVFMVVAAVLDAPWLCTPSVLSLAVAVMLDE